jgi:hypothetical protein
MATSRCKACIHPQRAEINAEILKGVSDRHLASLFPGVARCGFQRHRKHISQELTRAREGMEARDKCNGGSLASGSLASGSPGEIVGSPSIDSISVVEQISKFLPVLRAIVSRSMESRQYFAAAAGSREYREFLTLLAKLDGTLPLAGARPADSGTLTVEMIDSWLAEGEDDG